MFDLITISEAMHDALEKTGILIDVRSEEAYAGGHLPMAVHLPLSDIMDGKHRLDRKKKILLYCDTGTGSLMAARKLDREGYAAYSISGGISMYRGTLETGSGDRIILG